jgi:eukaryotic-like serine/threonine-protein kinase
MESEIYGFGDFTIDVSQRLLFRGGQPVTIPPKVFETLAYLVQNHGRLIEKGELLDQVWADSFVEEGNIAYNVRQLRKILGDDAREPRFIETIARRGYRFIARVDRRIPAGSMVGAELTPAAHPSPATAPAEPSRFGRRMTLAAVGVAALLIMTAGIYSWQQRRPSQARSLWAVDESATTFSPLSSRRITRTGVTSAAAISRDGRFVAYSSAAGGKQSLWLKQLSSEATLQIIPPSDDGFWRIKFSPDGEFLYFVRRGLTLYKMPKIGGVPTAVVKDAGGFDISPDGTRLAFVRNPNTPQGTCSILTSTSAGENERVVASREKPNCYKFAAWNPDGTSIVSAIGQSDTGDSNTTLVELDAADGRERQLGDMRWFHINSADWLADKSALIISARAADASPSQLWRVSYPSGEVQKLSADSASYSQVSLTSDSEHLLAVQTSLSSNLYVAPTEQPDKISALAQAFHGMSWMPDDTIVYSSQADNNTLWSIDPDLGVRKQLTFNSSDIAHSASGGQFVYYVPSSGGVHHIWRMNADGSEKRQVTDGPGEQSPAVSPDGEWVYYQVNGPPTTIWRAAPDGSRATQLTRKHSTRPEISRDGKYLAYFTRDLTDASKTVIEVLSLGDNRIVGTFSLSGGNVSAGRIRFSADGKSVYYATETNELTANIWRQPLDGSASVKVTNFSTERIFDFAFSADGKRIGMIRGSWSDEVLLIGRGGE